MSGHSETMPGGKSGAQDGGTAPGDDAIGERRQAVRDRLLARLDAAGMVRSRAQTAEAAAEMRRRLIYHLAYLPDAALDTLAELLIRLGAGPLRNIWPAEATVRNLAEALMAPPPEHARIITSWLASVEGPPARDGGYLTELYGFLLRYQTPPLRALDLPRIVAEAEDNRRQRARLRAASADGSATAADRAWLADYARAEARALELVAAGARRRPVPDVVDGGAA